MLAIDIAFESYDVGLKRELLALKGGIATYVHHCRHPLATINAHSHGIDSHTGNYLLGT